MIYTITETGQALTETHEGVTMPADYSFAAVNDFVHSMGVSFEELQALCLCMACYIEKLEESKSDNNGGNLLNLQALAANPCWSPSQQGRV